MTRVRKLDPFTIRDHLPVRLDTHVLRLVVVPVDQQRGRCDLWQVRNDGPVLKRAGDEEFRRAVPKKRVIKLASSSTAHSLPTAIDRHGPRHSHGQLHRRILLHILKALLQLLRIRIHAAQMLPVIHIHRPLVLLALRPPLLLAPHQRRLHLRRQLRPQHIRGFHPALHRGRAAADDEPPQAAGLRRREAGAQHAAPGVAEQVVGGDAEVGEQVGQLGHEERFRPEGAVAHLFRQVRRAPAAELVVEDGRDAVLRREVGDGEQVVVADAWPAVEEYQRPGGGREVAEDLVECLAGLPGGRDVEVHLAGGGGEGVHGGCARCRSWAFC